MQKQSLCFASDPIVLYISHVNHCIASNCHYYNITRLIFSIWTIFSYDIFVSTGLWFWYQPIGYHGLGILNLGPIIQVWICPCLLFVLWNGSCHFTCDKALSINPPWEITCCYLGCCLRCLLAGLLCLSSSGIHQFSNALVKLIQWDLDYLALYNPNLQINRSETLSP